MIFFPLGLFCAYMSRICVKQVCVAKRAKKAFFPENFRHEGFSSSWQLGGDFNSVLIQILHEDFTHIVLDSRQRRWPLEISNTFKIDVYNISISEFFAVLIWLFHFLCCIYWCIQWDFSLILTLWLSFYLFSRLWSCEKTLVLLW